jgi:hypothetical protein
MNEVMRSKAALWAGAGALALAGVATSLAAAGGGANEPAADQPVVGVISAALAQNEPVAFEAQQEDAPVPEPNEPSDGDSGTGAGGGHGASEALVRGIPNEDSPACANNGCGEVENAGGVTLHLPQPAVDGINRAAENRASAGNGDDEDVPQEAEVGATEEDSAVRGVPDDSPACEKHGCEQVETPGGVTVNVPKPAADGMAGAKENRENAGKKGNGSDGGGADDDPDNVLQSTSGSPGQSGGKPDWAGPPPGKGPNR